MIDKENKNLNFLKLFPDYVIYETDVVGADISFIYPEEEQAIQNSVLKRKREYATGRSCAHKALSKLGIISAPLVKSEEGFPVWPEGVVGSIAHCDELCGAAVASSKDLLGIGLDIESAGRITSDMSAIILTQIELSWISEQRKSTSEDWATMIFSAKESVYKCLFPIIHQWIDFKDVIIYPDPKNMTFSVSLPEPIKKMLTLDHKMVGKYSFYNNIVISVAMLVTPGKNIRNKIS